MVDAPLLFQTTLSSGTKKTWRIAPATASGVTFGALEVRHDPSEFMDTEYTQVRIVGDGSEPGGSVSMRAVSGWPLPSRSPLPPGPAYSLDCTVLQGRMLPSCVSQGTPPHLCGLACVMPLTVSHPDSCPCSLPPTPRSHAQLTVGSTALVVPVSGTITSDRAVSGRCSVQVVEQGHCAPCWAYLITGLHPLCICSSTWALAS